MKNLTLLTAILLATTTFAQFPNYVPTNGLVGWWPFNGNANDESGNGNNGTLVGNTILTSDRFGNLNSAFSFDGNGDYIDCGNATSVNITGSLSISAWIYANDLSTERGIITKSPLPPTDDAYQLVVGAYVQSDLNFLNSDFGYIVPLFNWVNVISVFDSVSNTVSLYTNGILDTTVNVSFSSIGTSSDNLCLGTHRPTFTTNWSWSGTLDDIGIWNRALTDCEIKDLFNSQLGSSNTTSSQTQTALDTYTWPVNNQTYTQSGTYSDTLVNAAGCDSIVTLNLTLNYTGINELNASQLVVFPNPTKDNFSISGLELLGTITSLEIKDAAGKVVKVLNPTTTNFSCVGLKAGVYFLAVTSNKTEQVIKIIKE